MNIKSKRERLLASSMICGAAFAVMAVSPAAAQQVAEVEELVVTGSRIVRPNLVEAAPVQVVGREKLEQQGLENISDVLVSLPQFSASFGASRTQSTFSGTTSSGLNVINLRNLGSSRSLVLINGRRAPSGTIFSNAVDLNTIPSANISRIDVITGGASAIYGADAVSGVVNIITDTNFEGVEMGFSYGEALDNHDNQNPSAFVRFGGNFDGGHAGLTLQYDYQGLVSCADRYICAEDFFWSPPGAPVRGPAARSGVPESGRYFVDGVAPSYTYINGAVVPFAVATHGYNRNAARTLAIPTERVMLAADADFAITDRITAFAELNYGSSQTNGPFEAHPFQSNGDLVSGLIEPSIPTDNPFLPADLRALALANGDSEITWWQRFSGLGDRGSNNLRQTIRGVVGLRGDFDTIGGFGSDWNWEASYVWGRTTFDGQSNGLVARDALYAGLRVQPIAGAPGTYECVDPLARAQGCVPINPFDGYSAEEQAWLVRSGGVNSRSELENGLVFLSGSIVDLPAGPLQIAVGAESRRTTSYEDYSTEINLGTTTGNQISDSPETSFKTDEFFLETTVPILRDLPFARELNVEAAYRWSDGSDVGTYDTWKYGGDWSPVSGLRFRAMKNRAVRAPVLGEVTGVSQTFGTIADPCINWASNSNATLRSNCQAAGVPGNYNPPLTVQQGVSGFVGGNPDLKPEVADTLTYGLVFQASSFDFMPTWSRDLTISVDRFEIELEGVINTVGRQNIAQLCYTSEAGARDIFCNQITRGSDPAVPGANYVLTDVNDQVQNIASLEIAGVDLEVNYGLMIGDIFAGAERWGSLNLNSVWTFYDKAEQTPYPGGDVLDLLGAAGGSTSDQGWLKRQGNTTLSWAMGPVRSSWTVRYIGKTKSAPEDLFGDSIVDIKAKVYSDFQVRWAATDNIETYLGMNNVFDEEPPFFPTSQAGTQALDTVPAYYDVFGRQAYAGVKLRF
ncbi:MAG: TonB-dependent receptor [Phenylobacterium sp.]|uniref:TonB-dependent receptor domain-containing protein n=1 Tax=Phenylobacterium sp. TaxID=1871053 RepID=UPI0027237349|nr:TonB-dependent receptor [Phenylobacterium sp.]MDO8408783.1 TonB-dependent receptor [Phenylobacterium sp.]